MHCYSGNLKMAQQIVKKGSYISFAGPITYLNSRKLQEIARSIDLDKILLETDSPWLTPQKMRGKRNEPAFLPFIAKKIAEIKNVSLKEVETTTTENAKKIYDLP